MSSIIDALKKSDANRPKKNHGLKMRMDLKSHSQRKNRLGFYAVILILILFLAAVYFRQPTFVWQYFGTSPQTISQQTTQTPVITDNPDNTEQANKDTKKLSKPAPKQVQSVAQNQQDKASELDNIAEQTAPAVDSKKATVISQQDTSELADKADDDIVNSELPNQVDTIVTKTDDPLAQQIDQQLDVTPMKNKQVIDEPSQDITENTTATASLPQLFELPFSIRKDLPKINLSVHIYDPDVENRMAIINGIPVHVGDSFEDLLSIQDITQHGVVFRIQNRDFIVLK